MNNLISRIIRTIANKRARDKSRNHRIAGLEYLESRMLMAADADFLWSMQDRFGLDTNNNGRIDMFNDPSVVQQDEFTVNLDASSSTASNTIQAYNWRIMSELWSTPQVRTGEHASIDLAEGTYYVSLTISAADSSGQLETDSVHQVITVRDWLIVSVGDSYSSGEGNPDVWRNDDHDAHWADNPNGKVAHRSSKSFAAQAALELERSDPHSSVTFVSVAASGDFIQMGLIEARDWIAPDPTNAMAPAGQIDQVKQIVGDREIDAMTMTIGGNDIGFAKIVEDLVLNDMNDITNKQLPKLSDLPDLYSALNNKLRNTLGGQLDPENVMIAGYPDITRDANGNTCHEILNDLVPGLEIDRSELDFARGAVINPLNSAVRNAASAHGWTFVPGVVDAFRTHGYCAEDPYSSSPNPHRIRWVRTANESRDIQGPYTEISGFGAVVGVVLGSLLGPLGSPIVGGILGGLGAQDAATRVDRMTTKGTLHPNEFGHKAIADRVLPEIRSLGYEPTVTYNALPPRIASHEPTPDQFTITFNKRIDPRSLTENYVITDEQGNELPITSVVNVGNSDQTFEFNFLPHPDGGYRFEVAPHVTDWYGQPLDQDWDGDLGESFDDRFWQEDFEGPRGSSVSHSFRKIRVEFNEPIDPDSFTPSDVIRVSSPNGHERVSVLDVDPAPGSDHRAFDIVLNRFPAGGYKILMGADINDEYGNRLDQNQNGTEGEWSADWWRPPAHIDNESPDVLWSALAEPMNPGLTGQTLVVAFSEDMDLTKFNDSNINIVSANGKRASVISVGPGSARGFDGSPAPTDRHYAISFSAPEYGSYTLELTTGITDWFHNPLEQSYQSAPFSLQPRNMKPIDFEQLGRMVDDRVLFGKPLIPRTGPDPSPWVNVKVTPKVAIVDQVVAGWPKSGTFSAPRINPVETPPTLVKENNLAGSVIAVQDSKITNVQPMGMTGRFLVGRSFT